MTFGTIFDIKRFALHDGKGLRTTVFLKGCPLSCPWCQNPEGLDSRISLRWTPSKCIHCGLCVDSCPVHALSRTDSSLDIHIDPLKCNLAGVCVEECPAGALDFDGRRVSAEDITAELLRDRDFFEESGGGVTLSGGEPLAQPTFAREILDLCRRAGVSTALETTLAVPWNIVRSVIDVTGQFLVDLKVADANIHKDWLGVDLNPIVSNLGALLGQGADVLVRIPLIPGYTATEDNLRALGRIIADLSPVPPVELLNFNPLAENKYRMLSMDWPFPDSTGRFTQAEINNFAAILEDVGVERITS